MMVRGVRVSQWLKRKDIEKLRRLFPGTSIWVQSRGWRRYRIHWAGAASYKDIRALADEIEAAVPVKAAITIELPECANFDWDHYPNQGSGKAE